MIRQEKRVAVPRREQTCGQGRTTPPAIRIKILNHHCRMLAYKNAKAYLPVASPDNNAR